MCMYEKLVKIPHRGCMYFIDQDGCSLEYFAEVYDEQEESLHRTFNTLTFDGAMKDAERYIDTYLGVGLKNEL